MFYYLNFLITNFVIDFYAGVLQKKTFKLSIKKIELLFYQIFNIAPAVLYLFLSLETWQFLLLKAASHFLVCLLISDSFKMCDLIKIFVLSLILNLSIYGFSEFFSIVVMVLLKNVFNVKIAKNLNFITIIAVLSYFAIIFAFFSNMAKIKELKKYLSKVSFCLFGRNIEMVGFLDSGNSLIDKKTGKKVVVVSLRSLQKYFKNFEYSKLFESGLCVRKIACEVAGGFCFEMPIIDIVKINVEVDGCCKSFDCVLGVVNQKFYDEKKYDCLLHRECF